MAIKITKKQQYHHDVSNFVIKFDGESEIDAETLSSVLHNVIEILKGIAYEIDQEAYVKLKINTTKKGSFEVDLATIASYIPKLFWGGALTAGGVLTIASLCTRSFKDILDIKKHLQGDKPKKVEQNDDVLIVTNSSGKELSLSTKESKADVYFQNAKFDNCVVNIFNKLNTDSGRTDFHMHQEGQEQITIKKEEYTGMSIPVMKESDDSISTVQEQTNANVFVKKPDFRGTSKWELMFLGKSIKAEIKDVEWLEKVHTGEISGFGAKVTIPVEMLIEYDVDKNNDAIPNTHRYTILKVTGNIVPAKPPIKQPENADIFDD